MRVLRQQRRLRIRSFSELIRSCLHSLRCSFALCHPADPPPCGLSLHGRCPASSLLTALTPARRFVLLSPSRRSLWFIHIDPRCHSAATHLLEPTGRTLPPDPRGSACADTSSLIGRRLDIPGGRIAFVILRTSIRFQLLRTPPRGDALTVSFRDGERLPGKDLHLLSV